MITQKYELTLNKITPYIFCNAENLSEFNLRPFGKKIPQELIFDCTKLSSEDFFKKIKKMDELSFGDQAMAMERWVLYDCSAMPGAIFGFAIKENEQWTPISMYIAIPMVKKNCWFGHNLSSLNKHFGGEYYGLGLLTKLFALKALKIKTQYGATQWGSPALHIHTKLASLRLMTSYTPIHTHKNSLTYIAEYTDDCLKKVLAAEELNELSTSYELEANNTEMLQQLQIKIESGEIHYISGKPVKKNGVTTYKIHHKEGL